MPPSMQLHTAKRAGADLPEHRPQQLPESVGWREAARAAVGRYLRARREALGLSQDQVALLSSSSPWTLTRAGISSIERGNNFPGLEALLVYLTVLDVRPADLLEIARTASAADKAGSGDPGPSSPDRSAASCLLRTSASLAGAGAPRAAVEAARAAVDHSRGFPEIGAEAWTRLSGLHLVLEALVPAAEAARRAVSLSRELPGPVRAAAHLAHGKVLLACGSPAEARDSLLAARKIFRELGDRRGKIEATGEVGRCLAMMRRARDAARWTQAAVRSARRHRFADLEGRWILELARISLAQGDLDTAGRLAVSGMRLGRIGARPLLAFRAGWIQYQVSLQRRGGSGSQRILALLCRLFPHLEGHRHVREVREFRERILPGLFSETP